jgi:hypothetical protein
MRLEDVQDSGADVGFDLVTANPPFVVAGVRLDETLLYGARGRAAVAVLAGLDGRVQLRELPGAERALPTIRELVALGLLSPRYAVGLATACSRSGLTSEIRRLSVSRSYGAGMSK